MNRNGLTSITIENFKGIGAPVTVPLRPITLLFGANSAGKSTIIQALQYAWEVLENRNPDVDRTRIGGEAIDLGGFKNLVHQHDLDRPIKITLEYKGDLKNEAHFLPDIYWSKSQDLLSAWQGFPNVAEWMGKPSFSVAISTTWNYVLKKAIIEKYEVILGGISFGHIKTREDQRSQFILNFDHPIFTPTSEKDWETYKEKKEKNIDSFRKELTNNMDWSDEKKTEKCKVFCRKADAIESQEPFFLPIDEEETGILNNIISFFSVDVDKEYLDVPYTIPEWEHSLSLKIISDTEDSKYIDDEEAVSIISQIIVGAGETVLDELRGLRYLGPLREVPNRIHTAPLKSESSRWANGMGAWDALLRSPESTADDYAAPSLVEQCSNYLHNTLKIQYKLRREDRIQLPADGELFSRLRLMASRFDEVEDNELQRLVSEIEELNRIPVVQLHDEKNDIDVNPMDIGVGVSQTLPVVVGAVDPNCTIFAVEQPELHIHPAVQVNLADIFLREVLEPDKKPRIFLLETHSEHLVLRIMRRMRETCENTLPAGFPKVNPEDVAVLYVEPSEAGTQVIEIPINEEGEFDRPWPKGFFTERARELM